MGLLKFKKRRYLVHDDLRADKIGGGREEWARV